MSDVPDCPDCVQGKHRNCDCCSWDNEADTLAACPCDQRGHRAPVADPKALKEAGQA